MIQKTPPPLKYCQRNLSQIHILNQVTPPVDIPHHSHLSNHHCSLIPLYSLSRISQKFHHHYLQITHQWNLSQFQILLPELPSQGCHQFQPKYIFLKPPALFLTKPQVWVHLQLQLNIFRGIHHILKCYILQNTQIYITITLPFFLISYQISLPDIPSLLHHRRFPEMPHIPPHKCHSNSIPVLKSCIYSRSDSNN